MSIQREGILSLSMRGAIERRKFTEDLVVNGQPLGEFLAKHFPVGEPFAGEILFTIRNIGELEVQNNLVLRRPLDPEYDPYAGREE